jgi:hypothetical protein
MKAKIIPKKLRESFRLSTFFSEKKKINPSLILKIYIFLNKFKG